MKFETIGQHAQTVRILMQFLLTFSLQNMMVPGSMMSIFQEHQTNKRLIYSVDHFKFDRPATTMLNSYQ